MVLTASVRPDTNTNKIRNEEFKIWKKSIPSIYQHISTFKPSFTSRIYDTESIPKTMTFTHELVPDKEQGTLTTSVLYSQGSDIFEVPCSLPLGLHSSFGESLPEPQYHEASVSEEHGLQPKWSYQGENIIKLQYVGTPDCAVIAMASNGSLAWFKEGIKVPVKVMAEIMGPSTSFSMIHSLKQINNGIISDFALSHDTETVVKTQSRIAGSEESSILKIVDNSDKPGELLRTINIPGTTVSHTVKFHNNHLFSTCSDDNRLRFWDTRSDKPVWSLSDPKNGSLTCFDVSPVIDTLFVTGTSTGVLKLWDLRAVAASTGHDDDSTTEIVSLYHSGGDSVADVQFGFTSPTQFLSVGGSGNVYHWDLEYLFASGSGEDDEVLDSEELQQQCLKFMHTGGGRRSIGNLNKRGTVSWHEIIDDVVGCVDADGLLTVYKGYYGREDTEDVGGEAEEQAQE